MRILDMTMCMFDQFIYKETNSGLFKAKL